MPPLLPLRGCVQTRWRWRRVRAPRPPQGLFVVPCTFPLAQSAYAPQFLSPPMHPLAGQAFLLWMRPFESSHGFHDKYDVLSLYVEFAEVLRKVRLSTSAKRRAFRFFSGSWRGGALTCGHLGSPWSYPPRPRKAAKLPGRQVRLPFSWGKMLWFTNGWIHGYP